MKKQIKNFRMIVLMTFALWISHSYAFTPAPGAVEQKKIEALWQKTEAARGRDAAIKELTQIASDIHQDLVLRRKAVEKLADVKAVATMNLMRSIADSIPADIRDTEYDSNETMEQHDKLRGLRCEAILAYHKLRFFSADSPEKQYGVLANILVTAGSNASYEASCWALDMLVLRGEEQVLTFLKSHRTFFSNEESLDLLRREFAVMKSPEGANVALEKVVKGDHSQLKGLDSWTQDRLQQWARRMQNEISTTSTNQ